MNIYISNKIIFINILCLLINCFAFLNEFNPSSIKTDSPVIKSSVFGLVYFARLPFTIMADMMKEVPLMPEYKHPVKKQNVPDKSKRSHDNNFYFICPDNNLKSELRTDKHENTKLGIYTIILPYLTRFKIDPFPDREGLICIFLLMYLALLKTIYLPWQINDYLFNTARLRF